MPLKITRNPSLKIKLAVYTAITTALVFLFLIIYVGISQRSAAYSESKTLALEVSRKASLETEKFLSAPFEVTRELSKSFEVLKNNRVSRSILCQILKKTIENNNDFLAIWFMWEPNAFDGKDRLYANKEHYDSSGTFSTSYFRANNEIKIEKNDIIDYQEDYYTIPRNNQQELLTDPYKYQYRGYDEVFYETSTIVPLVYDSIFCGVVAIDINVKNLQDKLNSFNIYKTGYVSLITNSGIIVSHPNSTFEGKNIETLFSTENDRNLLNTITFGEESYETTSAFTGKSVLRFVHPIKIENTNSKWYALVEIPLNEITNRSNQLLLTSLIILLIGISLLIYLTINILERRKYEKVLIDAKHKAEESEKAKTAFLSNISHEIRTPMNGIIGFSNLIAHKDTNDEQRQLYKESIQNSCNQLLFIINDVLDFSSIEAGHVDIKASSVSLDELITNLKLFFDPLAKEKNIQLHTKEPATHETKTITTDELKLKQILSNLINNSIKFTEEGFVEFGYKTESKKIIFHVKDTGIGIKPNNREKVFERFHQEDNFLNKKYKGTGLGLPICKAYTEMIGGKIWFEPNNSRGTTFFIEIPCSIALNKIYNN